MKEMALILLLATQAMALQAQGTTMSTTMGGGLETNGLELAVCAYSAGWRELSVRRDWGESKQEPRSFQLMSDGKACFEGTCRYDQCGDSVRGEIKLT